MFPKVALARKRKTVLMLLTVVVIFSVCWLPYHLYFVLSLCLPSINNYTFINLVFLVSHWLAMSNSCYNPFIYSICSPSFRQEFHHILCWQRHRLLASMVV